jgi:hypothetical protein
MYLDMRSLKASRSLWSTIHVPIDTRAKRRSSALLRRGVCGCGCLDSHYVHKEGRRVAARATLSKNMPYPTDVSANRCSVDPFGRPLLALYPVWWRATVRETQSPVCSRKLDLCSINGKE